MNTPLPSHPADDPAASLPAGVDSDSAAAHEAALRREAVVQVHGLRKVFGHGDESVAALDGVDLEIAAGSFTAIMGASGSGKSTLLHVIGGLTPPTDGDVLIEGVNLADLGDHARTVFRRRRIGVIFQEFNLLPTLSAAENIGLPRLIDGSGVDGGKVDELLDMVRLSPRRHHRPDALSGGEQQRVAIARALLMQPAIVLADEPTGALDSRHSLEIWKLLRQIACEQGRTILMVTHEAQGAAFADEVIILKDGRVVGRLTPGGDGDASAVASGYQKLAGF